jgi:hypothetical protein
MYYKLSNEQENYLINQPETGMGYQIIEAFKSGSYSKEKFLVLNSELVIETNGFKDDYVRRIINEGISSVKTIASVISLSSISVLNENQFRNVVAESKSRKESAAIDNPVETANGIEIFVRLSAFDDDKRVDKVNKYLRPGSYTTTMEDYTKCKDTKDDPVDRYALPNNDKITQAFHIQPLKTDTLQRGTVQPANEKRGGGKEVYFDKGTANGTFIKQTPY